MKTWNLLLVSSAALFLVSCARLAPPSPSGAEAGSKDAKLLETLKSAEHREVLKAASQRLDDVRDALKRGDLAEAEAGLQPLLDQGLFANEVNELRADIRRAKDAVALEQGKKEADQRALTELEQRYTLPTTYGSTVTITGEPGSFTLPPGPMEAVFSRKVTIQVENAGVKELVQALRQVEGMNIIADDAIEAKKNLTIDVKDTPLSEILSYIARNMGITFSLGENVIWVSQAEDDEEGSKGPKLETHIYRLKQGFIPALKPPKAASGDRGGGGGGAAPAEDTDLEDALESLSADSPEGASYRVFRNRNLLMVRNSRENLRLIEQLIEDLDKPPRQVLIEARFLTISQADLLELGMGITNTNSAAGPPSVDADDPTRARVSDFLTTSLGTLDNPAAGALTLGGVIGGRTFDVVISALEKNASTRTLSAPRITVLNNQTAHIRKGDTIRYWDNIEQSTASGNQTGTGATQSGYAGEAKELEVGVTLDVKVSIGNDGQTVLLGLQPEVMEIKEWRPVPVVAAASGSEPPEPLLVPDTTESTLTTAVAVKSGETVVLGGMLTGSATKQVRKVPYLGSIPYLGALFRHKTNEEKPTHLLIFVTATVVSDSGQFVRVKEAGL